MKNEGLLIKSNNLQQQNEHTNCENLIQSFLNRILKSAKAIIDGAGMYQIIWDLATRLIAVFKKDCRYDRSSIQANE